MLFVCPDPAGSVRAANVQAATHVLCERYAACQALIEAHCSNLVRDDAGFVPIQPWLNALAAVHQALGDEALFYVGKHVVKNAQFPPELTSVAAILLRLDGIYRFNHHGQVGHYDVIRSQRGEIFVHCSTPYPPAFEHGLVEGICHNRGATHDVERQKAPAGSPYTCVLIVRPLQPDPA